MRHGIRYRLGRISALLPILLMVVQAPVASAQNVADIRTETAALDREIQKLRAQLVRGKGPDTTVSNPASPLERLDLLQEDLRRLTGQVDLLYHDLERIVAEASKRTNAIERRLSRLEGDEASTRTESLIGGGLQTPAPSTGRAELPLAPDDAEQAAFAKAKQAVDTGNFAKATRLLEAYLISFPGAARHADALFLRGEALAGIGDLPSAARSYLDAFSSAPDAQTAPSALLRLSTVFVKLGQADRACQTLAQVRDRYPETEAARLGGEIEATLTCP